MRGSEPGRGENQEKIKRVKHALRVWMTFLFMEPESVNSIMNPEIKRDVEGVQRFLLRYTTEIWGEDISNFLDDMEGYGLARRGPVMVISIDHNTGEITFNEGTDEAEEEWPDTVTDILIEGEE